MPVNQRMTLRFLSTIGLLATACLLAPTASAVPGYLVNINGSGLGTNIFGGTGDTIDIGLFNHQCSDENDFLDVGVANREGDAQCAYQTQKGCDTEDPGDPRLDQLFQAIDDTIGDIVVATKLIEPSGDPDADKHCSDDGDTIDVGLLNEEGSGDTVDACRASPYYDEWGAYQPDAQYGGDFEDGVDAGLLNTEYCDDDDADDVGVLNCEYSDFDDGIDVGVLNNEYIDDSSDTFDLSLLNFETMDGPDRNGLDVLSNMFGLQACFRIAGPIDPSGGIVG